NRRMRRSGRAARFHRHGFAVAGDRAPHHRILATETGRVAHGADLAQGTEALVELALDDLQPVLVHDGEAEARSRAREERGALRRESGDVALDAASIGVHARTP